MRLMLTCRPHSDGDGTAVKGPAWKGALNIMCSYTKTGYEEMPIIHHLSTRHTEIEPYELFTSERVEGLRIAADTQTCNSRTALNLNDVTDQYVSPLIPSSKIRNVHRCQLN